MSFLLNNNISGLLKDDPAVFRRVLHGMWFALYPRANRVKGSCAFEHVFLGEVKAGQVNGFHNWLFFLLVSSRLNLLNIFQLTKQS